MINAPNFGIIRYSYTHVSGTKCNQNVIDVTDKLGHYCIPAEMLLKRVLVGIFLVYHHLFHVLARSSIHQPTILVCHGATTVNPHAFTPL